LNIIVNAKHKHFYKTIICLDGLFTKEELAIIKQLYFLPQILEIYMPKKDTGKYIFFDIFSFAMSFEELGLFLAHTSKKMRLFLAKNCSFPQSQHSILRRHVNKWNSRLAYDTGIKKLHQEPINVYKWENSGDDFSYYGQGVVSLTELLAACAENKILVPQKLAQLLVKQLIGLFSFKDMQNVYYVTPDSILIDLR
jgi:hypothetical protein